MNRNEPEALHPLGKCDRHEANNLQWLQQAWSNGVNSGDYGPLDLDAIKVRAQGRKRLATDPEIIP